MVAQSKTNWLYFLAHFSTDQDEIWCSAEAVKTGHPDTTSSKIWFIKRNICYFTEYHQNFSVGMQSNIFKVIWFQLSMMIDTAEHYNVMPVLVILTLSEAQGCKKAKTCVPNISVFLLNLD